MANSNLKLLLTEYEQKRLYEIEQADKRKELLYKQYPRLQEIDDEISQSAISISKSLLDSNRKELLEQLNHKINALKEERSTLLQKIGKTVQDLLPQYSCTVCEDTGYYTEHYETKMCNCLKQKLFDLEYNKSNISNLKNQSFSNFLSTYYSDKVDKTKYGTDISPRENIEIIKDISLHFIQHFNDPAEKNLLFTGNTGLGKTFLSSCIANELLKQGKTVLYQTSPVMLDTIINYRFNRGNVSSDMYQNLLTVDLLIIDDLGTENVNSLTCTELFNIINTRLLQENNKSVKTIISTNLSLNSLFKTYDERIVSRFVGNYTLCYFFGDDIRFQKNKKN